MPAPLSLKSLAVVLTLCAASSVRAFDADPEPRNDTKDEPAAPAVDLAKLKTDRKIALQNTRYRLTSTNNLKQIALAVYQYHDTHNFFPNDIADRRGKPMLSWRVAILPYLGADEAKLYRQFKLDEPWDSRHNKKLLARMPSVFASPRVRVRSKSKTVYQAFTGTSAVFGRGVPARVANITDGTSNTLMAVETSTAVPWTRPGGIPFDRAKALPDFGKALGKKPLAVMMDASVRVLNLEKITAETLKNAIDPSDGNVLGKDWNE
jgi:hypothetical protein